MPLLPLLRRLPFTALAVGLLWAAAFPKLQFPALAWLAPAALLLSAASTSPRSIFFQGFLVGLVHYLISLHWLLFIPFPTGAVAGWLALSAYMALFPAIWVSICWALRPSDTLHPTHNPTPLPSPFSFRLSPLIQSLPSSPWHQRASWALVCAIAWSSLEFASSRLLSGFPWNLLGASQYQSIALIQIASITGVYGVSFLVAWFSSSLACATSRLLAPLPTHTNTASTDRTYPKPFLGSNHAWAFLADLALPLLALASALAFGLHQIAHSPQSSTHLQVALVQPSIPQNLIFDPKENTNRFAKLIRLSQIALATKPDLLIWPEAATPNLLRYDPLNYQTITNLLAGSRTWMILGADDAEPNRQTPDPNDALYFNSAFAISPSGEFVGDYRKRRLVIFGEYVPLSRWLPFLRYVTPIDGGFEPGTEPGWFNIRPLNLRAGILICFEDVFPQAARECVDSSTDFLLNLTNNGWFGESAAQWQHAASSVFRAVENQIPLIRCTNNGLTCWIDPAGRLHAVHFDDSNDIYSAGIKTARIPTLGPGVKRSLTFYTRHGDVFAWSCSGITLALLGLRRLRSTSR